ncbi:MAG: hypothetical protein HYX21_03065 [Candidatus Yanofskybacteria bacterium]|nr:hypothetical protein [Candidatus Yanofskybacteria bacterium]
MTGLEKSVLATIIYYDVFDFPLTLLEVFNLLINPRRISVTEEVGEPDLEKVFKALEELKKLGEIQEWQGFYFPSRLSLDGRMLVQERLEKNKIAEEKWKKARRYLFWVQALPYIEAVFASGSLALNHTAEESDLDVLVVASQGRIWIARVFISLLMGFLGVRRKKNQTIAPDKVCLNHYITSSSLKISFESLYNAQSYVHLAPIYCRKGGLIKDFLTENRWVLNFVNHWPDPLLLQKRRVASSPFLRAIAFLAENFLEVTFLGSTLNKLAKKLQLKRINPNLPGRVIANDQQLEFHPYSAEKTVLEKYNRAIASRDVFGDYRELDSGLK